MSEENLGIMTNEPGMATLTTRPVWVPLVAVMACLTVALAPWLGPHRAYGAEGTKKKAPKLDSSAWYWEEQETRDLEQDGNTVHVEKPNPYCPSPGGGLPAPETTCAEGRLPIEIRNGDYETPNKMSAVAFDLTTVPAGSKVKSFTVTFLEAKSGCYRSEGGVRCETTDPVNVDGHKLQACLVTEFFGEGAARPYEELPRYKCSDDDPIAERVRIKGESPDRDGDTAEPEADHEWTFDLTAYAQEWKSEIAATTAIMIHGAAPKRDEAEGGPTDTWSVVLAGPKADKGIVTEIVYRPPLDPVPPVDPEDPPDVPPPSTDFGTDTSTDFGSDTSDETDAGSEATTPDTAQTPVEAEEGEPASAAAEAPEVETLPGYVWLVIIAGLIGFSMLRAAVVESTSGARPDGVLAQIRKLNLQRRGAGPAEAAVATGAGAAMLAAVRGAGGRVAALAKRVPLPGRGSKD